ncbi:MAG: fibrobacter succinogenes major paralogous domain-containing protein [Flavobacteriales bacterium]|nr:fibrobacter succinogenes major paralogous domain-containing protein [Flavobacteriales bacterium]
MRRSFTSIVPLLMATGALLLVASCKKDKEEPQPQPAPVPQQGLLDVEGNGYDTVVIGGRTWMAENLRVSKYRNGDPITTGLNFGDWQNLSIGAYAIYDDASSNNATYGKLYNWYTTVDLRGLCPTGWSIPSDQDWADLEAFVGVPIAQLSQTGERGAANNSGGKLKATQLWSSPNLGATNSVGFAALPAGHRSSWSAPPQSYGWLGLQGHFWTSTSFNGIQAYMRVLTNSEQGIHRHDNGVKTDGISCRCI